MISAVVLTKNEENNIKKCLKSLQWCDEMVVIDDFSTDNTIKTAKSMGAVVFKRELGGDFSAQRNFGLERTKGDWVIFVDADEIVTPSLASEIKMAIKGTEHSGFLINRVDTFFGVKMKGGEWGSKLLVRLVKKGKGKWERSVHETLNVSGKIGVLSSPLLHSPSETISSRVDKINLYSTIHAVSNLNEGKNENLLKIVFWPIFKFFDNFVLKRGYKDATYGFAIGVLMSFHSFLAWSKQWELKNKK